MQGLSHLEYRGYDSAGLALQGEGGIEPIREVGRLENLGRAVAARNGHLSRMRAGIGHTRWATHGRPSEANAHPQMGGDGAVAVVHNGIIENFAEIKAELQGRGVRFESETDTEVMAHLLAERVGANPDEPLRVSLSAVLELLEGSFAVAAVGAREPGVIVAARHQSPLVVGLGEGEN
ncbi:MAG: glutamine--fructose-6-phosphate aminotransferase, partial [Actinomycetota bacterium]|nr:glutamine--fructose-6-phosphate aminotransferase [Actinomycetota bacterium]